MPVLESSSNGHLLELIKTEFARRFENEDTATCGLGEVANIWNKTVKPTNIPGTLWEHYSIPAFDAEQYPSYELGDTIKSNKYEVVSNSILVSKLNPSTRRLWIPQLIDEKSAICSTEIIYVFLTIFLYLPKCPQSLILSALRAFCFCGKPRISRSIFLYFPCQSWLKSW